MLCGAAKSAVEAAYHYCESVGFTAVECANEVAKRGLELLKASWEDAKRLWAWAKGVRDQVFAWPAELWEKIKNGDSNLQAIKDAYPWFAEKLSKFVAFHAELLVKAAGDLLNSPRVQRLLRTLRLLKRAWDNEKQGGEWNWSRPFDSAKRLYNALVEVEKAFGNAALGAFEQVGEMASKTRKAFDDFVVKVAEAIRDRVRRFEARLRKTFETKATEWGVWAKGEVASIAKRVAAKLLRRLIADIQGGSVRRPMRERLVDLLLEESQPLIDKGVSVALAGAKAVAAAIFGVVGNATAEAICAAVATAVASGTGGIGALIQPLCACALGLVRVDLRDKVFVYVDEQRDAMKFLVVERVVKPLIQKALVSVVEPAANQLLADYEKDLLRLFDAIEGTAAEIRQKLGQLSGSAKELVPTAVFEALSKRSDAVLATLAKEGQKCLAGRPRAGFFGTIDCLAAAATKAMKDSGLDKLLQGLARLLEAPASEMRARYQELIASAAAALASPDFRLPGPITQILEGTWDDVIDAFAQALKEYRCGALLTSAVAQAASMKLPPATDLIGPFFDCLKKSANEAKRLAPYLLVARALRTLAELSTSGAQKLRDGIRKAISMLSERIGVVRELVQAIPESAKMIIANASDKALDAGATRFAEGVRRCQAIPRGASFADYSSKVGDCVFQEAKRAFASAGTALLEGLAASAKEIRTLVIRLATAVRDKAPGAVRMVAEALNALLNKLGAGRPIAVDDLVSAAEVGSRTLAGQIAWTVAELKPAVDSLKRAAGRLRTVMQGALVVVVQASLNTLVGAITSGVPTALRAAVARLNERLKRVGSQAFVSVDAILGGMKTGGQTFASAAHVCIKDIKLAKASVVTAVKCVLDAAAQGAKVVGFESAKRLLISVVQTIRSGSVVVIRKVFAEYQRERETTKTVRRTTGEGLVTVYKLPHIEVEPAVRAATVAADFFADEAQKCVDRWKSFDETELKRLTDCLRDSTRGSGYKVLETAAISVMLTIWKRLESMVNLASRATVAEIWAGIDFVNKGIDDLNREFKGLNLPRIEKRFAAGIGAFATTFLRESKECIDKKSLFHLKTFNACMRKAFNLAQVGAVAATEGAMKKQVQEWLAKAIAAVSKGEAAVRSVVDQVVGRFGDRVAELRGLGAVLRQALGKAAGEFQALAARCPNWALGGINTKSMKGFVACVQFAAAVAVRTVSCPAKNQVLKAGNCISCRRGFVPNRARTNCIRS